MSEKISLDSSAYIYEKLIIVIFNLFLTQTL